MANLDVSFLVSDADFADAFKVFKRSESVNEWGELTIEETEKAAFGTCQAATAMGRGSAAEILNILPQGANLSDYVKVFIKMQLAPRDVIEWRGRRFVVESVENWGNYGAGFYTAICKLESVNG